MTSEVMYGHVESLARVCIENDGEYVRIEAHEQCSDALIGRSTMSMREAELLAHMLEFGDEDVILTTRNITISTWDRKLTLTFSGGEEVYLEMYVAKHMAQAFRNVLNDAGVDE